MRARTSTIGLNAGWVVTSSTRSPSIHTSRPSRSDSRYSSPVRIMRALWRAAPPPRKSERSRRCIGAADPGRARHAAAARQANRSVAFTPRNANASAKRSGATRSPTIASSASGQRSRIASSCSTARASPTRAR